VSDISHIDIDYVANLARLELTSEERERIASQLAGILAHFERIREVDVSGVEPTAHAVPLFNILQEDHPGKVLSPEAALSNAPMKQDGMFVVPKVVEDA
jgi:aspartyl-tRNA(Asn)/glutamyl-tRNA(Gln) amidotransferase subunit C